MAIHKGSEVNSSTSPNELLSYVILISSSITAQGLISMVNGLDRNDNSKKIGSLMCGSSMNIRKVINELRMKSDVSLSEEWMVNTEINFSVFAMGGHTIFMLPDESLTAAGQMAKAQYRQCIGGVENISKFNESTVMEGKEERAKILLKWAKHFKGMDVTKHQNSLSRVFPHIVKDRSWFFSRWFGSITGFFGSLISRIFNLVYGVIAFIWNIVKYAIFAFAIIYIIQVSAKSVLPTTTSAIVKGMSSSVTAAEGEPIFEALFTTLAEVPSTSLNIIRTATATAYVSVNYLSAVLFLASRIAVGTYPFITEAVRTGGDSVTSSMKGVDMKSVVAERFGAFSEEIMRAFSALVSIILNEPVDIGTSVFSSESIEILKAAILDDMASFGFDDADAPVVANEKIPEKVEKKADPVPVKKEGNTRKVAERSTGDTRNNR